MNSINNNRNELREGRYGAAAHKNVRLGLAFTGALAGVLLLSAAVAAAPGRAGRSSARFGATDGAVGESFQERRTARLAEFLSLTDEQIAAWEAQREVTEAALEPIREAMQANRETLQDLLESDAPDATEVGQAVLDGKALREQAEAIHEAAQADFEGLLTAEQLELYETFKELRPDRGRRGRDHRGRGGRGSGFGADGARFGGAAQ